MPTRQESKACKECGEVKTRDEFPMRVYNDRSSTPREFCNDCKVVGNRRKNLMSGYRMSLEEWQERYELQGGRCYVCGELPGLKGLMVDHDHECCPGARSCGKCVRALICGNCNVALGMARDSVDRLRRLADYVEEFR